MQEHEVLSSYSYREPESKHYERIPGFIDYLTYIEQDSKIVTDADGNKVKELLFDESEKPVYVRKRLKPAHKDVYRVIKKLAGESACIRTEKYIARMAGCSTNTVADAKAVLRNPIEQMDGNSLLSVDEQWRATTKEDENGNMKKVNKRPVHICMINPVWKYNNPFMTKIYSFGASDDRRLPPEMKQRVSLNDAEISIEKMAQPSVSEIVHKSRAKLKNELCSEAELKNELCSQGRKQGITEKSGVLKTPKQNPLVKEQTPMDLDMSRSIQMSLINQKNVEEYFVSQSKTSDFLEILGFKRRVINDMFSKFCLSEIAASVLYLRKMLKKRDINGSLAGYLMNILDKKWWMPKAC